MHWTRKWGDVVSTYGRRGKSVYKKSAHPIFCFKWNMAVLREPQLIQQIPHLGFLTHTPLF